MGRSRMDGQRSAQSSTRSKKRGGKNVEHSGLHVDIFVTALETSAVSVRNDLKPDAGKKGMFVYINSCILSELCYK